MTFHILKPSPYKYFYLVRYTPRSRKEMKAAKDAGTNRFDDMMQYYSQRRDDRVDRGDRGDRKDRQEKVAEYLKNLNLDESDDESLSNEDYMEPPAGKRNNAYKYMDKDDADLLKSRFGTSKKDKKKNDAAGDDSELESTFSGSISLSDLSTDSEDSNPGKKKSPIHGKKPLSKIKYEDLGKALSDTNNILESFKKFGKKAAGAAGGKKPSKPMTEEMDKKSKSSVLPKNLREKIDKKLSKLEGKNTSKSKAKKDRGDTTTSSGSDDMAGEGFLQYLQSAKGRKVLESVGKKFDKSPFTEKLFEKSLADFDELNRRRETSKFGSKPTRLPPATEPPRQAPSKKFVTKEPPMSTTARATGGASGGFGAGVSKTGTINKVPNREATDRMRLAAERAAKSSKTVSASTLAREAKSLASKLESKAATNMLKGEKKQLKKTTMSKK